MTTAADIITRAAKALGYLGNQEVLSAADATNGLNILNAMLDSWSGESLASYADQTINFNLVPGTQTYTIGPTGVWVTTRPTQIYQAYIRDTNQLDYPLIIYPQDKWDAIGQKNITSQIPTTLFYDSQYPNGNVNIFPIPLLNYTLYMDVQLLLTNFASLTTALSMPPGYERAYIFNLALELMAQGFPCVLDPNQLARLIKNADDSKGNIKRANIKEVISEYDEAVVSKSYATYNIYSDTYPRQ